MKHELKTATQRCRKVLSTSELNSQTVTLSNGYVVTADKIYRRFGRFSWTIWYGLNTPNGQVLLGGHTNANSFVELAVRKLQ